MMEDIKWRSRQIQQVWASIFQKSLNDILTKKSLCSLVSLVKNNQVPVGLEYIIVLVDAFVRYLLGTTEVLHGSKINVANAFFCKVLLKCWEVFTFVVLFITEGKLIAIFGTILLVLEIQLVIILKPTTSNSRTVCENKDSVIFFLAYQFQGTKCLSKAHLCIPQVLMTCCKMSYCRDYSILLLFSKSNRFFFLFFFWGTVNYFLLIFYSCNSFDSSFKIYLVPFLGFSML